MATAELAIKVLTLETGKCPFEEWYTGMKDTSARVRIAARIKRLQTGDFGDCKSVGQGVSELRLDFRPGYRIYFARQGTAVVVLLAGGDKSAQDKDIANARKLWKEHRSATERFQRDFGP